MEENACSKLLSPLDTDGITGGSFCSPAREPKDNGIAVFTDLDNDNFFFCDGATEGSEVLLLARG